MNILKTIAMLCLLVTLTTGVGFVRTASAQPGVSVPIQAFYDELAPYGQWVQHPYYGSIWLPSAGPGFQPYVSDGHWVVTEYGNTWVSDYPWGWAPFHYGRWIFDDQYGGWAWIPGSDWGPAWVSWRSGGGYYGWAPLGPGVNVNVNINIPAPYWTFVPQIYINSPQWYGYRAPRPRGVAIYQNTTIINNVYQYGNQAYFYGPYRGEIERVTRRPVQVYRIDQLDRPGRTIISGNSVGFYRPGLGNRRDYDRGNYGYNNRYDNNYGSRGNGGYNDGRYGNNYPDGRRYDNGGRQPGNAYPDRRYDNTPNGGYNGNNRNYPGSTNPPSPGNPTNGNGRYDNGGYSRGDGGFGNGNRPDANRGGYNNPSINQPSPQPTPPQSQPERQYNGGVSREPAQPQPGMSRGDGGFAPGGRGGFSQPSQRMEQPQGQPAGQPQGGEREAGGQRGGRGPR